MSMSSFQKVLVGAGLILTAALSYTAYAATTISASDLTELLDADWYD